jgi:hypothetical protein
MQKRWVDLKCDFSSTKTPKDCFAVFEASLSESIDKISIPDCLASISPLPTQTTQDAPEVITFLWPEGPENQSGRIVHAGRGKNCTHSQCFELEAVLKGTKGELVRCPVCSASMSLSDLIVCGFFGSLMSKYERKAGCCLDASGEDCDITEEQENELCKFVISTTGHCVLKVSEQRLNPALSQRLS